MAKVSTGVNRVYDLDHIRQKNRNAQYIVV